MDPFYINVAKKCFPYAKIIIDHYHVIAWGLTLLDQLRRNLQVVHKKTFAVKHALRKTSPQLNDKERSELQKCFKAFPEVKRAWYIIQELRGVYWQKNWRKAYSKLRKVIWFCEQAGIPEMEDLAKTLKRWKMEILNYYISRTTNACTEALHGRFENIKRQHFGIRNVERFAKRLMFCMLPFSIIAQIFTRTV